MSAIGLAFPGALRGPQDGDVVSATAEGPRAVRRESHRLHPRRGVVEVAKEFPGLHSPHHHVHGHAPDDARAVRRSCHRAVWVRLEAEPLQAFARIRIHQLYVAVIPCEHPSAVRGSGRKDRDRRSAQGAEVLPSARAPDPGYAIAGAGEHPSAIGRNIHRQDRVRMTLECPQALPGVRAPDLRRSVIRAREDPCAVRGKGRRRDLPGVSGEGADELARARAPQRGGSVRRRGE
mmetsp:Transcript_13087/g.26478  ORF Transcript_13087/g.26478 Transcript_13087/m.26478 type:complete len:234 (-) Transcript_13087:308-1009(-)